MLKVRESWDSREVGLFINLQAFANCPDFMGPDARLPNWNTIVADYPHLIDSGRAERPRRFSSPIAGMTPTIPILGAGSCAP